MYFDDEPGAQSGREAANVGNDAQNKTLPHARTAQAEKLKHLGHIKIPEDFSYHKLASLSFEAKQKLTKIKPKSIDQASRVSGVSPSDISVLLVYMGR